MTHQDMKNAEEKEQSALYGVSDSLVESIVQALDQKNLPLLYELIDPLHAADVADLIENLSTEDRRRFIEVIKSKIDPDVLISLEDDIRDEVLELLGTGSFAKALSNLDSDDALHLIEDLDAPAQRKVLDAIPAEERAILEEVLTYPEDSAGRLMQRQVVCVPTFWSVGEVLAFINRSQDIPDTFYNVYVVDPKHHPIGVVSLNNLLRHSKTVKIADIMTSSLRTIPVTEDQEEVALLFRHYALVSAPVVDESGRIVGMITVDDVVDVIDEEAEEDIMHIAGVKESDFHMPVVKTSYWRARWLLVTLINTLIAATVIAQFESSIKEKVALSFLMVIVGAMGGNAGMQTVTVTVRALATRELHAGNAFKSVGKEVLVSLITGALFSIILGVTAMLWLHDWGMGMVLAGALMCNMLWAGFSGTVLPILVDRLDMDPAISAGPLLTTATDVFGYAIFLGIATYFLL